MSFNNPPYNPGHYQAQYQGGIQQTNYPVQATMIQPTAYSGLQAAPPIRQAPAPPPGATSGFQGQPGVLGGGGPLPVDPTVASWFRAVDQDNSGQVNATELRQALQNGNWSQFSEEACTLMIAMFDKNHKGTINMHEFDQLFKFVNQWTDTYRRYDQDNSGTISENEMSNALQQMGYRLSPQFIGFLVTKYSQRRQGITLDHFILINIKIRNLTDAFRAKDTDMRGIISVSYEDFLKMTLSSV